MNWWDTYPYLAGTLRSLPLYTAALWYAGPQRTAMLLAGACALPLNVVPFLDLAAEGYYWRPNRLGGLYIGVEDFLFLFQAGGASWFLTTLFLPREKLDARHIPAGVGRLALLLAAGLAATVALQFLGAPYMAAAFVGPTFVLGYLLFRRRDAWKLGVVGCLSYTALYYFQVIATLALWPTALDAGNATGPLTRPLLGMPAGEWIWALIFGSIHPMLVAFVFRIGATGAHDGPNRTSELAR